MTTASQKRNCSFSLKARKALQPGPEVTENGLVSRKRKDGIQRQLSWPVQRQLTWPVDAEPMIPS
ncbi:hypothetical protein ACUQ3P_14555, partial [Gilvimarinus sp. DZF01]|uniref:hypothetical protein n=1 Tax=Gilvimarinus sp. DZF01 TaxID=3461371 RepID=UPI0040457888